MSRVSYESLSSVSSVDPDFPDMSGTPSLLYSASFGNLSFNGSLAASVPYERRQDRLPSLDLDQMALRATVRLRANEGVLSRAVSRQEVGHHDAQKKAAKLSDDELAAARPNSDVNTEFPVSIYSQLAKEGKHGGTKAIGGANNPFAKSTRFSNDIRDPINITEE